MVVHVNTKAITEKSFFQFEHVRYKNVLKGEPQSKDKRIIESKKKMTILGITRV